jgi:CRISPR/Cas system-associated endonuclease Cas1
LDACYGFLHDGRKPGRLSLVWDCVEPLRPGLVRAVFEFAAGRVFRKDDFAVIEGGIVRPEGQLIREIATLALTAAPIRECVKVVRWLEGQL